MHISRLGHVQLIVFTPFFFCFALLLQMVRHSRLVVTYAWSATSTAKMTECQDVSTFSIFPYLHSDGDTLTLKSMYAN